MLRAVWILAWVFWPLLKVFLLAVGFVMILVAAWFLLQLVVSVLAVMAGAAPGGM